MDSFIFMNGMAAHLHRERARGCRLQQARFDARAIVYLLERGSQLDRSTRMLRLVRAIND
jgi:hypothetical protein